jgi:uncharacterized protein YneF (UPF0154 family)
VETFLPIAAILVAGFLLGFIWGMYVGRRQEKDR